VLQNLTIRKTQMFSFGSHLVLQCHALRQDFCKITYLRNSFIIYLSISLLPQSLSQFARTMITGF